MTAHQKTEKAMEAARIAEEIQFILEGRDALASILALVDIAVQLERFAKFPPEVIENSLRFSREIPPED